MASNTTGRDYDIGRMLDDHRRRIEFLERQVLALGFLLTPGEVYDTGWVACTMEAGTVEVGGHEVQVRRIGEIVFLRGRMTRTTSTATQQWATMPAQFWPDRIVEIPVTDPSDVQAPVRTFVESGDGGISSQGTPIGGADASLELNASWIRAV